MPSAVPNGNFSNDNTATTIASGLPHGLRVSSAYPTSNASADASTATTIITGKKAVIH